MTRDRLPTARPSLTSRETYTLGHADHITQGFAIRTAETFAAFFLPHLKPAMTLLDCGCGPGSITVDLARVVAPGQVIGIDRGAESINQATALARARGVSNVHFQVSNVYELPFPDGSFDAVFAHVLFAHLSNPSRALMEMHRVLKPGGLIGVRDVTGTRGLTPRNPLLDQFYEIQERVVHHHGGNMFIGWELKGLLRQAEFTQIEASASCGFERTPEAVAQRGEIFASRAENSPLFQEAINQGWIDCHTLSCMAAAWREWSQHPDAFLSTMFSEVVGWRKSSIET